MKGSKAKPLTHCFIPNLSNNDWTIRRQDDRPSNPVFQRTILEIDWFLYMPVKFWKTIVGFWFFLSCLINTVMNYDIPMCTVYYLGPYINMQQICIPLNPYVLWSLFLPCECQVHPALPYPYQDLYYWTMDILHMQYTPSYY